MKTSIGKGSLAIVFVAGLGCSADIAQPRLSSPTTQLQFGPEIGIGRTNANPSTPFLRYSPDGRLFAVWTEDHDTPWPAGKPQSSRGPMSGDRAPSPMRNALVASSSDGGKTWTPAQRINSSVEAVRGEENGPKLAFDRAGKLFVIWSTPGAKGDKTRTNIRFAKEAAKRVGIFR